MTIEIVNHLSRCSSYERMVILEPFSGGKFCELCDKIILLMLQRSCEPIQVDCFFHYWRRYMHPILNKNRDDKWSRISKGHLLSRFIFLLSGQLSQTPETSFLLPKSPETTNPKLSESESAWESKKNKTTQKFSGQKLLLSRGVEV